MHILKFNSLIDGAFFETPLIFKHSREMPANVMNDPQMLIFI